MSMKRILPKSKIPHIKDCIAYIESCGWAYNGKTSFLGNYVFCKDNLKTISFSLREIRDAFKNGW